MTYGVILALRGVLRTAVSVEWTEVDAPIDSGTGWEPCVRLPDGRWRLARHDSDGRLTGHWRAPGRFGNIGLRYRLVADGAWSPVSADRKEIEIVALSPEDAPAPVKAADWSVPVPLTLVAGQDGAARSAALRTGAFVLGGSAAAAVAVQWTSVATPGDADWRDCVALAGGRWHMGAGITENLAGIAIRYRLAPEGAWSAASEDRKPLGFPELPVVPVLLLAPFLMGTGRVGEPVVLEPGLWTGAPALAFQWCRNGVAIPGATVASYRPGTADDGQALTCRVTAATATGRLETVTAALSVTHVPPVAVGALEEEILDQGTGVWTVPAAPAFRGLGLRFSVTGAGASVDAATGVVSLATDVARATTVAVTATNSGGAATVSFRVTIEAAEGPKTPLALGASGWSVPATVEVSPSRYAGVIELSAAGPAAAAVALEWRDASLPAGTTLAATALGNRRWRMDDPTGAGRNLVLPGGTKTGITVRYRLAADGAQGGSWSELSTDAKTMNVPAFWRPLERTPEMLSKAPATYGFGYQYMRSMMACEDEPQYLIGGGDMNGIRLSDTGGASWFHPPSVGLRCPGFNSVAIDPRDHRILLAAGNMVWWGTSAKYQGRTGLWRSTDFGDSWTQVLPLEVASTDEYNQTLFAYAPASRSGAASARVWYFLQSVRTQGKAREGAQFWRSADGGASWAKVGAQLAADQFGEMYALLAHPVTANSFYVAAQTGLWNSKDGGGTWTKVAGNLPAAQCRSFAISANGSTLYASIQSATATQAGVWYSTNGGTSWSRVQDNAATKRLSVDWKTKPETIYVQLNQSTGADLLVARGPSGPWTTPSVTPMLGYEDDAYHKRLSSKGSYDGVLAHPGATGVCIVNSVGRNLPIDRHGYELCRREPGLLGDQFRRAADQARGRSEEQRPLRDRGPGRQSLRHRRSRPLGPDAADLVGGLRRAHDGQSEPQCLSALELRHRLPALGTHPSQRRQLWCSGPRLDRRRRRDLQGARECAGRGLQLHRLSPGHAHGSGRRPAPLARRGRQLSRHARLRRPGAFVGGCALRPLGQQHHHALGQLDGQRTDLDGILQERGFVAQIRPQQPPDGNRSQGRVRGLDGRCQRRPHPRA